MLALFAALALAVSQQGVRPEDDPDLVNREPAGGAEIADPTESRPTRSAQQKTPGPAEADKKGDKKADKKSDGGKAATEEYTSAFDDEAGEGIRPAPPKAKPKKPAPPPDPYVTPKDAKGVLAYADHLFLDGDWYRSISEYRRFLYMVKGRGDHAPRAALAVGEALLRGEQWDAAGRQLDGVAARTTNLQLRRTALFGSGRAYLLDGRPELAKPRFRLLAEDSDTDVDLREEATWLLAWGHFDAGELEKAREIFAQIAKAQGHHAEEAEGVVGLLDKEDSLATKNVLLAGALSLVPGLGHFYLGQWMIGITSLSWNALFIVAAVLAWVQGQWGPAIILTFMELGWYSGGVFGAISGAYKHNRDVVRNWRDQIIADYGQSRELPTMDAFADRHEALPGNLIRFGASF